MNITPISSPATAFANPHTHNQEPSEASIIAKIGDVVRGSLLAENLEQIPMLLQSVTREVEKRGGKFYVKNFWKERAPLSLGYVGIHVKIRMALPNNKDKYILMEVQIHPKQIMDGTKGCTKEIAHRLYKIPEEDEKISEDLISSSQDLISSSQLFYLTSMTKLLKTKEELEEAKKLLSIIEKVSALTEKKIKKSLVLETALLLGNCEELGYGKWNKKLDAVVPNNKEAVNKAWIETANTINTKLQLPTYDMDASYSWTNTATSVDELLEDAELIASDFITMCVLAANQGGGIACFGPKARHAIKEKQSLQDKINKDKQRFLTPTLSSQRSPAIEDAEQNSSSVVSQKSLPPLEQKVPLSPTPGPLILLTSQIAPIVPMLPPNAFGATEWRKYFGDVGTEPPLPSNINQIRSRCCPFWPSKTIEQTHRLVLVPQTVNGQPLTLNLLGKLVKKPLEGNSSQFSEVNWGQYTDPPAPRSHWVLMTREVIPESLNKCYKDQQAVLAGYSQQTNMPYVVPTILDITVATFMEHVRAEPKLHVSSLRTYARCQEKYSADWQLAVGWGEAADLIIGDDCEYENIGVVASLNVSSA